MICSDHKRRIKVVSWDPHVSDWVPSVTASVNDPSLRINRAITVDTHAQPSPTHLAPLNLLTPLVPQIYWCRLRPNLPGHSFFHSTQKVGASPSYSGSPGLRK